MKQNNTAWIKIAVANYETNQQEKSKIQLERIKEYIDQQSMSNILPQSPIGKAIAYTLTR